MEIKNHQPRPGFTSVAAFAPSDPFISLYQLFPHSVVGLPREWSRSQGCQSSRTALRIFGVSVQGHELDDPQGNSMILQFRGQQGRERISPKPNFPSISDPVFNLSPLSALTDRWTLLKTSFLTSLLFLCNVALVSPSQNLRVPSLFLGFPLEDTPQPEKKASSSSWQNQPNPPAWMIQQDTCKLFQPGWSTWKQGKQPGFQAVL